MKQITKLLSIITVSLLIAGYTLQYTPQAKRTISNFILKLPAFKNCYTNFNIKKIGFILPRLEISNIVVSKQDWKWEAKKIYFSFNWLDLFFKKEICLNIEINEINATSKIKNKKIKILKHIKKFLVFDNQKIKIKLNKLELNKSKIKLIDEENQIKATVNFTSQSKEINQCLKSSTHINKTKAKYKNQKIINNASGIIQSNIPFNKNLTPSININLTFHAEPLNKTKKRCFLIAGIENNKLTGKLQNLDCSLKIDPIEINLEKIKSGKINIQSSLNIFKKFMPKLHPMLKDTKIESKVFFKGEYIKNITSIKDLGPKIFQTKEIQLNLEWCKNLKGFGEILKDNNSFELAIDTHKKNKIFAKIFNKNKLELENPFIRVEPQNFYISSYFKKDEAQGLIYLKYLNLLNNKENIIQLNFDIKNQKANISGFFNKIEFKAFWDFQNINHLRLEIYDQTKKISKLIVLKKENNYFKTDLNYKSIKSSLPEKLQRYFAGQKQGTVKAKIKNKKIKFNLDLPDINLIIPYSKNFIKDISGTIKYNIKKGAIKIKKLNSSFNQGFFKIDYAKCLIKNFKEIPEFIIGNASFDKLNISYQDQILASVSGRINITKNINQNPTIKSDLIINNGLINNLEIQGSNNNLKSLDFFKPNLEIKARSKRPIQFRTNKIDFKSEVKLKVNGSLDNPKIESKINIENGKLKFPYKSLKIYKGSINVNNGEAKLDIHAKNKIKHHDIFAHVMGTLQKPDIKLNSNSELTEEQIGSLLITGSTESTLNLFIPTILVQNLQNLIFKSKNNNILSKKIFKPLKHIKLISNLENDQDIKGGVEIDISDKLYAIIQKNINSQEEADMEIDYKISDNINVRGIKDKSGNAGGEIEMRWRI